MSYKSYLKLHDDNLPMVMYYKGKEYFLKYTSKNRLHMSRLKDFTNIDITDKKDYNTNVKGEPGEDER